MRILPLSRIADIPKDHQIITGAISGGSYSSYLREQMQIFDRRICIRLEPVSVRISLPSYDGQGSPVTQDELAGFTGQHVAAFSDALCCNYIFIPDTAAVILFDDETSLQKKLQHARELDVSYVLLPDEYIKSKTP